MRRDGPGFLTILFAVTFGILLADLAKTLPGILLVLGWVAAESQ